MFRFTKAFLKSYVAVFVLVVSLVPAFATEIKDQTSNIQIKNFGRISDNYYRGGQPEGHDYTDLATFGIKTVINLTNGDGDPNEKVDVEKAGMKYFQIPMTTHVPPTPAQLIEFLHIVNDPADQPVYVHCVGGKHRTGVMTAVYRMTQHGWTADQAFEEMKQFKFGASFLHSEFKKFVFDYYNQAVKALKPAEATAAATTSAH